jgi:hypothetical protein
LLEILENREEPVVFTQSKLQNLFVMLPDIVSPIRVISFLIRVLLLDIPENPKNPVLK